MQVARAFIRRFAVHGVIWRNYLDFAVENVPFYLQPILIFCWTVFFFFLAAPARRALLANYRIIFPHSSGLTNNFRAFRTLLRFAQTITDAANFRVNHAEFDYEIIGPDHLDELSQADGAVLLTAHMGNYDLGAALFAQKYDRAIRMVRAPEPDQESGRHLHSAVEQSGKGAVQITYNTAGALIAFDLLQALRSGEIVSIQGDRVTPGLADVETQMFGATLRVPSGPFTLALAAEKAIYPLFVARVGHYRYRIICHPPFQVVRAAHERNGAVAAAAQRWADVLESTVSQHWDQWFAFTPVFSAHG